MAQQTSGFPKPIIGSDGTRYKSIRLLAKMISSDRDTIVKYLKKNGFFKKNGVCYRFEDKSYTHIPDENLNPQQPEQKEIDPEYEEFLKAKEIQAAPFERYEFRMSRKKAGSRYAIALFSDAHIEETVKPESVLGKNEYNIDIAKERIEKYFVNLVNCINEDKINSLIFASLGDLISNFIHDELFRENALVPTESVLVAQNIIFSGLSYICENTKLDKILFIGIVGNHGRTTKKIQHSNGFKMNYEWLIYQNVKQQCETAKLPIEFNIPESEVAVLDMECDGRRFLFSHGFQIKGGTNTVCGITPSLQRTYLRYSSIFGKCRLMIGHFHSCIAIPSAVVNGSIIGYNAFALSHSLPYEEPAQMYVAYDSEIGELLTRRIYCK